MIDFLDTNAEVILVTIVAEFSPKPLSISLSLSKHFRHIYVTEGVDVKKGTMVLVHPDF